MRTFYTSVENQIHHIDGIGVVKDVLSTVTDSCINPMSILDRDNDFLGGDLKSDAVWKALFDFCPRDEETEDMIRACLSSIKDVLTRQYERFFATDYNEQLLIETEVGR